MKVLPARLDIREAWPAVGIAALVFTTLAPALLTRSVFYERDILAYWYPGIEVFVRAVREGGWPVWNPYGGFGTPLWADPNLQLAYPLTWLNLVVPRAAYYKLFVAVHCLLGGLGARALARRQGLRPLSAFVAGTAFAASGPFLSAANLFHHFTGAAWMPWVLWAFEGVLGEARGRSWLALGAVGALQVLAGSGDLCLMTAMAVALRFLVHLQDVRRSMGAEVGRLAPVVLKAGALALLLSAVQWLPTLALLPHSTRTLQGAPTSTYWSLHPLSLVDLVVPRLMADLPMGEALRGRLFESREPLLVCLYWGLPALTLASLALPGPGRMSALVAGGLFVVAALGRHTPLYALFLAVPGASVLRYPVKFLLPASLFLALLAARGVERLGGEWRERDRRLGLALAAASLAVATACGGAVLWLRTQPAFLAPWLEPGAVSPDALSASVASLGRTAGVAVIAAALLWLRSGFPRAPGWLVPTAAALVAADLATVGAGVNRLAPPELAADRPPAADRLASGPAAVRIYSARRPKQCWEHVRIPPGWDERWTRALAVQQALVPPVGARWGLYGSYDGEFTGLGSARAAPVIETAAQYEATPLGLRLLRMGAVDYVVGLGASQPAGLSLVEELPSVYPCPLRVFRVGESLPRAYLVDGVRAEPPGDVISALADPAFDPSRSLLLPLPETPREPSSTFRGEARVMKRRMDALTISVEASAPAYLVVAESFAPGWRAAIDGRPVPVLRANVLFRGVAVSAGRHVVEFVYRAPGLVTGAALSVVGLLVILASFGPFRGPGGLAPSRPGQVASALGSGSEVPH